MNNQPTNYDLFVKLFNNCKAFVESKTGIKTPESITADHALAYLTTFVKGKDLSELERFYKTQYKDQLESLLLSAEDENKIRRYLQAMLELL